MAAPEIVAAKRPSIVGYQDELAAQFATTVVDDAFAAAAWDADEAPQYDLLSDDGHAGEDGEDEFDDAFAEWEGLALAL